MNLDRLNLELEQCAKSMPTVMLEAIIEKNTKILEEIDEK